MKQLRLLAGDWEALIQPAEGAAFDALRWRGWDILVPTPAGALHPGAYGAFWMLPWANRLDGGQCGPHLLPVNRPDEHTAIHGFARDLPWQVEAADASHAILVQRIATAPFTYLARLMVTLSGQGLRLDMTLLHEGAAPLPYGMGWHPWFPRPAGFHLDMKATQRASHDARGLPFAFAPSAGVTGGEDRLRVDMKATQRASHDARGLPFAFAPSAGVTGGEDRLRGLDHFFVGWDGRARLSWPDCALNLHATGDFAMGLQVYAPRDQAVICVEPVSHMPDAPNRPALAALAPMRLLAPGEALAGSISLSPA